MELKPGYKQTEVGVIPEDWDALELEAVCTMKSGEGITASSIDDFSEYPCSGGNGLRGYTTRFTHDGRFALIGRQGALCGNVVSAQGKFFASEHAVVVTPRAGYDIDYLTYVLGEMHLNRYSESSAQPGLSVSKLLKLPLAAPRSEAEQRSIAMALRNVDALLGELGNLIAKRRGIKQAAMQELLTGERRLPGFEGEWEVKRLGDVGEIKSGGTPSTSQGAFWDGGVPWCTPTDITALDGRKYLTTTARTISPSGLQASSAEIIPPQSLIMTTRATIGECAINTLPMTTNQGFKNIVPSPVVGTEFLYYLMSTQKQRLISLCGGSTFLEIGKKELSAYEIRLPLDRAEQDAISSILSAMDKELQALEAILGKAENLKQGMMQQLLTGKIRLQ
ncbi:MAG: restriction endonuclease subunit S [Synechococcaceae cyanobacterium]